METIQPKTEKNAIKVLIKPASISEHSFEVTALCEPNKCGSNCNNQTTLESPDTEMDLLF